MAPQETFHYFGLYSIVLFLIVTSFISYKWHIDNSLTFSRHVAEKREAYLLFAVTSVIGQTMFWLFMVFWFVPFYSLSPVFTVIFTVGSICQITAALVADHGKGLASTIHYRAAWVMVSTMLIFAGWMGFSSTVHGFARLFSLIAFCIMATILLSAILAKKGHSKVFIYQNVYLLLFYATVLVTAYTH